MVVSTRERHDTNGTRTSQGHAVDCPTSIFGHDIAPISVDMPREARTVSGPRAASALANPVEKAHDCYYRRWRATHHSRRNPDQHRSHPVQVGGRAAPDYLARLLYCCR